ncbi:hypothetical protein JCM15415_03270 [Methanobacterium movens]
MDSIVSQIACELFSLEPLKLTPKKSVKHNLAFSRAKRGIPSIWRLIIKDASEVVII